MHAGGAVLWWGYGRGREGRAEDAAVGDRERAAFKVSGVELVAGSAAAEVGNRLFDFGEAEPFSVAKHGDHKVLVATDGNADVVVVAIDDLVVADFGVECWLTFE